MRIQGCLPWSNVQRRNADGHVGAIPDEVVFRAGDRALNPWFGAGGEGRLQALRGIKSADGLLDET